MGIWLKFKNLIKSRRQKEKEEEEEFEAFYQWNRLEIDRITGGLGIKIRKKGSGGFDVVENYTGETSWGQTKKEALEEFINLHDVTRENPINLEKISENFKDFT